MPLFLCLAPSSDGVTGRWLLLPGAAACSNNADFAPRCRDGVVTDDSTTTLTLQCSGKPERIIRSNQMLAAPERIDVSTALFCA